jgi:predicted transcriptional regulator
MIPIKKIMKKDFPKCSSSSSIRAAVDVMEKMNVDYMPVEEEGKMF